MVQSDMLLRGAQVGINFDLMVPTWTGKMGKQFPVGEKSGNFEQTEKVRQIDPKREGILPKILEK